MGAFIRCFFFWLLPTPIAGDRYVIEGYNDHPWSDEYVIIVAVKNGWVKYQLIWGEKVGSESHLPVNEFKRVYTKLKS
jgi:hypothetical protein